MAKTTTFQKVQLGLSIIPYYSTFFVLIVTMVELKRKKASWKAWGCYFLIMVIALALNTGLSTFLSYEEYPMWHIAVAAIIYAAANTALVFLQVLSQGTAENTINRRFRIIFIVCVSVCAVALGMGWLISTLLDSSPDHIEDMNGPDTSLATITMEEICTTRNAGTANMGSKGSQGAESLVEGEYAIFDHDSFRLQWKKLSGIYTLQATQIAEDSLTLTVDTVLAAGNAEIMIFIDDLYYAHVPIGRDQQVVLENVSGKLIVVKLAAESAEIALSINRRY